MGPCKYLDSEADVPGIMQDGHDLLPSWRVKREQNSTDVVFKSSHTC